MGTREVMYIHTTGYPRGGFDVFIVGSSAYLASKNAEPDIGTRLQVARRIWIELIMTMTFTISAKIVETSFEFRLPSVLV